MKRELDSLVTQMHAGGIHYDEAVREFKRRFILEVLSHHRGNQCKAARELSMHRNTLRRTIAELKLDHWNKFAVDSSVRPAQNVLSLRLDFPRARKRTKARNGWLQRGSWKRSAARLVTCP